MVDRQAAWVGFLEVVVAEDPEVEVAIVEKVVEVEFETSPHFGFWQDFFLNHLSNQQNQT